MGVAMATAWTLKDTAFLVLGLWGAGLSTYNIVHMVRRDRRKVHVTFDTLMPYVDGVVGYAVMRIQAVNVGHRPVTITTMAFELEGGATLVAMRPNGVPGMPDSELPLSLEDGDSAQLHMPYQLIAEGLTHSGRHGQVKLIPFCRDSTGREYRGDTLTVNTEEYSRM